MVSSPLLDKRHRINSESAANLDAIGHCTNRYKLSLIAATLRWLEYTERRAVLVVSRDGFIMWARPSSAALKTGAYFRASRTTIAIPEGSVAARKMPIESPKEGTDLPAGVWFSEPCTEMAIFSENYDFTVSLLCGGIATARLNCRIGRRVCLSSLRIGLRHRHLSAAYIPRTPSAVPYAAVSAGAYPRRIDVSAGANEPDGNSGHEAIFPDLFDDRQRWLLCIRHSPFQVGCGGYARTRLKVSA